MPAIDIEALGVGVRVETADSQLAVAVQRAWSSCSPGAVPEPQVLISLDDNGGASYRPLEETMEQLTQAVTVESVAARAGDLLMLHACALADPESGNSVILVGPSGMGKTTLAATLGKRWAYVTDETAAVTEDGALVAYPKPLSVFVASGSVKAQISPSELGLVPVEEQPLVPHAIVLLNRVEGRGTSAEDIRTVPAIALLAEHTSYLGALDAPLHRLAALVEATGGLRRLTYSEASDVGPVVAELMGGRHVA